MVPKLADTEQNSEMGYVSESPHASVALQVGCGFGEHLSRCRLVNLLLASLWLTVLPLLVGAQLWSLVVSLVLFVLLHAILLFSTCVPLFPFCMLLVFCLNFL
jgi:hypothetical protein